MSEFNVHDIMKKQKMVKPKIEDVIPEYLDGDTRKIALDFIAHIRENKMQPTWGSSNWWAASYRGKAICHIRLPRNQKDNHFDQTRLPEGDRSKNFWVVSLVLDHINEYESLIMNEGLQNLIWDNLYYCNKCNPCAPGISKTILGREIKDLCRSRTPFWFWNPDERTVSCIKRLLELEKMARHDL